MMREETRRENRDALERQLWVDAVEHVAATIRRVDGDHTMGAGRLAEHIVNALMRDRYL